MKIIGAFLILFGFKAFAEPSPKYKNTYTHYRYKKPEGVCFETSNERYLIKKKHTVSDLMLFFKLRPLYCIDCSVEIAQNINKIPNVDFVLPGQILTIPKKCESFSWKDDYDYYKISTYSEPDSSEATPQSEASIPYTEQTTSATSSSVVKKKLVISYNKLGVDTFGVFSEINGVSSAIQAKLVTDFGKGVKFYYQKNLDSQQELIFNFSAYSTEIKSDKNNFVLTGTKQIPLGFQTGYRYFVEPDISISGIVDLNEDIFFEQNSAVGISVSKALNKSAKLLPEYTYFFNKIWSASASAGVSLYAPSSFAGSSTNFGYGFESELKAVQKLNFGRVYAGATYAVRKQKNDVYDFQENAVIYRLGTYYLF